MYLSIGKLGGYLKKTISLGAKNVDANYMLMLARSLSQRCDYLALRVLHLFLILWSLIFLYFCTHRRGIPHL